MIVRGRIALNRKVITHLLSAEHQIQPCGIDLTVRRVMKWSSSGTINFDTTHRKTADTDEIPFEPRSKSSSTVAGMVLPSNNSTQQIPGTNIDFPSECVDICCGSYLIEFNELILVRSSLFRSGALINAGVMDSGYKGAIGVVLQVVNPRGLRLLRDAKLAQMVFHQMSEPVEGYNGVYQGRAFV
ncbi:putative dUTP diphosphatase Dut [Lophium mytilinum]|uniref:Putative dUTP diphosphatase Dut n=1 Tax=Lophium mytilinum TaxID=390894 RepID=A0A6A6QB38_9PEZI|nr:putative dUTP diphosphatase Dut [Lophium mytilinum]